MLLKGETMKVVIVTGSPWAGLTSVWEIIRGAGVEKMRPSDKGVDIGAWHRKVFNVYGAELERISDEGVLPGQVWSHEAISILQANVERCVMGWADAHSTEFLEFWRDVEPRIIFVLVYNSPGDHVGEVMVWGQERSREVKDAEIAWSQYNTRLLCFFNRNRSRCLLVNRRAVQSHPEELIRWLNRRLDLSLKLAGTASKEKERPFDDPIRRLIGKEIVRKKPELEDLYAELQSSATIPAEEEREGDVLGAWAWYRTLTNEWHQLKSVVEEKEKCLADFQREEEKLKTTVEEKEKRLVESQGEVARLRNELRSLQERETLERMKYGEQLRLELKKENEILLLQLQQVQEELEHYLLIYHESSETEGGGSNAVSPKGSICIGMDQEIEGDNWYSEERHDVGSLRWTGPGERATIDAPLRRDIEQLLVIHYRQTVTPEQFLGLRFEIDGVSVGHTICKKSKLKCITLRVPTREDRPGESTRIGIILPKMVRDKDLNPESKDTRPLGLCVYGIYSVPFGPSLRLTRSRSWLGSLKLKVFMWLRGLTLDSMPLSHFDGIGYLKAHPHVAEAVRVGKIPSALDYYVTRGGKSDEALYLSISDWPTAGDKDDLQRMIVNGNA
jgi:hypothetical protein